MPVLVDSGDEDEEPIENVLASDDEFAEEFSAEGSWEGSAARAPRASMDHLGTSYEHHYDSTTSCFGL